MSTFDYNKFDIRKREYDNKYVIWARKRHVHSDGKLLSINFVIPPELFIRLIMMIQDAKKMS